MIFGTVRGLAHMDKALQSDAVPCQLNCGATSIFFGVKLQDPTVFKETISSLKHTKLVLWGLFFGFFGFFEATSSSF